jgi:hypothetical protein
VAHVMKNPALPDYFLPIPGISRKTPLEKIPSLVSEYEDAKVLTFPDLKLDIDHDFWATLPADEFPALKKMLCNIDMENQDWHIKRALRKYDIPLDISPRLFKNMQSLLSQIMPIYYRIFGGYTFSIQRAVWRLNTIHNENLHFDTYKEEYPEHFARMFINLDSQPRIWNTGYTTDQIFRQFRARVPSGKVDVDPNRFWRNLQQAMFGPGHPFDNEPRHSAFFDPGDVWVVDSRQVAHQIFYGRRAISIDFVVTLDSMQDRRKHYLEMSRSYQTTIKRERELA